MTTLRKARKSAGSAASSCEQLEKFAFRLRFLTKGLREENGEYRYCPPVINEVRKVWKI